MTPDASALRVTGLIDLLALVIPSTWTPSAQMDLVCKTTAAGGQKAYMFSIDLTTGRLKYTYSTTGAGTSYTAFSSTLPTTLTTAQGPAWVRCLADPTSGTGGNAGVTFYYSFDGATWTQIGLLITGASPGPWAASTAPLRVGQSELGSGNPYSGRLYRAQVWNGNSTSGGTLVADFDAESIDPVTFNPGTTTYTDTLGRVWTSGSSSQIKVSELTNLDFPDASIEAKRIIGLDPVALARGTWFYPRGVDLRDPAYNVTAGAADSAVAITAAMAAESASHGGDVFLAKATGKYFVNHPIVMQPNVGLGGQQGFDGAGTDVCNIRRGSSFPQTTTTSSVTTPADATTSFTLPVSSTATFPMCSGGITLTYGIGVLRISGISVYYRSFDGTNFLSCTTNYPNVTISLGATVTCDLVWDGEPGNPGQIAGTWIEKLTIDALSTQSRAWWSAHCSEGGGPRRCRMPGGVTGFMTFEYPPRTIGGGGAIAGGHSDWALPPDSSLSWSGSTPATTDAIGIDVYATPFTGTGSYGRGHFKALDGVSIGGSQGGTAKADIRVNGIDGSIRGAHLERAGIIIGDLQETAVSLDDVQFGQVPDIDYGLHLGPYCIGVDARLLLASRLGAIVDPNVAPTDGAAFRLIYDEVTGKKAPANATYAMYYQRGKDGVVHTDVVMA